MAELRLQGQSVLVIGGGTVATRKIRGLLETGAELQVLAPECSPELRQWQQQGLVSIREAVFTEQDLEIDPRPLLVFAATGSSLLNQGIARMCHHRNLLCNSADDPRTSGFLVPAVVRRGGLTVAVGTQGASPALSRLLKERIEHWLEPGWQGVVEVFGMMRAEVLRRLPDSHVRQAFWRKIALLAEQEQCHRHPDPRSWFLDRLDAASKTDSAEDHPALSKRD